MDPSFPREYTTVTGLYPSTSLYREPDDNLTNSGLSANFSSPVRSSALRVAVGTLNSFKGEPEQAPRSWRFQRPQRAAMLAHDLIDDGWAWFGASLIGPGGEELHKQTMAVWTSAMPSTLSETTMLAGHSAAMLTQVPGAVWLIPLR